jgi:hypothetical protein
MSNVETTTSDEITIEQVHKYIEENKIEMFSEARVKEFIDERGKALKYSSYLKSYAESLFGADDKLV